MLHQAASRHLHQRQRVSLTEPHLAPLRRQAPLLRTRPALDGAAGET